MQENEIDTYIRETLKDSVPGKGNDVRRETMDRIINYEARKEKARSRFYFILTFLTALASLVSLALSETIISRARVYLLLHHINPVTMKVIYQGFFACVLLGMFALMIYSYSLREDFFKAAKIPAKAGSL